MPASRQDTQLQGITDLCLLTPIKPGFVNAFETITHLERLRRVLKTLNALRQSARESSETPELFTDVVSRFRIVHSFRWAIVEPRPGIDAKGTPHKFLLNVCFDGGWEPYMRVIWDDLGSMLDLMLCHCEGYRLSRETSFERYIEWVRANEFSADFLYLESGRSCGDHDYLAELERQGRLYPEGGDLAVTRLRRPLPGESKPLPSEPRAAFDMAVRGLPALAALYSLERYFLPSAPDGYCLLRASRDVLFELRGLDTLKRFPLLPPTPEQAQANPLLAAGYALRATHYKMLAWFETVPPQPEVKPRALAYRDADIQGGMLSAYPDLVGGALVLLRVANRSQAVAWLSQQFKPSSEAQTLLGEAPAGGFYRNVALSLAGLRALGVPASRLARFPQAFQEGMEARAGVLGDLRHNHPRYWKLPERNWPRGAAERASPAARVDLNAVHLVVQLRFGAGVNAAAVDAEIASLERDSGLQVLAVQDMRRNIDPGSGATRENFGFIDGISQPQVDPQRAGGPLANPPTAPGKPWSDAVPRGEVVLGFPTSRDRHAVPEKADALLDLGSFLVVRKLRQHVGRLQRRVQEQAQVHGLDPQRVLAKMMGRSLDGEPLAAPGSGPSNGFTYQQDSAGSACPFHAHIRRVNPREGAVPRVLRRGMSYGPATTGSLAQPAREDEEKDQDRGLIFMAYNAHLAEQFETLQRWIAGGNASGGLAEQADPFLAVATQGKPRVYRFEEQTEAGPRSVHLDLGDQPFVELQWGAYFFVPSLPALRHLPALVEQPLPAAAPAPQRAPALDNATAWQQWLEDASSRDAAWAYVRAQPGGVLRTAYGVLVGEAAAVLEVFRDSQQRYSVRGYGERMQRSIGLGYLGMDEDGGHREQAPAINTAIESISEPEAFAASYRVARAYLAALKEGNQKLGQREALLDIEKLSEVVLDKLCTLWFGLPNDQQMLGTGYVPGAANSAPRCPRDFFAVSRYVFGPQPGPVVEQVASAKGQGLQRAVREWLETNPALPAISQAIKDSLSEAAKLDPDIIPRTLAGIMLGFPPTVHGNQVSSLAAWVVTKKLWDLQQDWLGGAPAAADQVYARAVATLRPTLLATMMRQPVPAAVWRRARVTHHLRGVEVQEGDKIIVGIVSCAAQNPGDHTIMFGGDRYDAVDPAPIHACPGYAMAVGVMLGVAAGLLEAGVLRATPSPTVLAVQLG
ncbi:Dyp-type peroxidase [Kinneretia aquatilis]|uniref:Dyp-type peroxidase n=1 Tax=Kinneretia aquatilis TaxID=2070761 RepID=UPI001495337B|nr:Dyp-type peroxidase domain-containing protein [Paucibacter aquatile]WIV97776.1 Dyp-type peroxidase [Paucibacter aquatile]